MKIFHSFEDAEKYADKNFFKGTYIIEQTRNGNFRIAGLPKKQGGDFYEDK